MPQLLLPGLVDAHVHLREPGGAHKEDAFTGTRAALAGGVIAVLDMPNNTPPVVDGATYRAKASILADKAVSDYGLFVGLDAARPLVALEAASEAAGLKIYMDETFGNLTAREPAALAQVFEAWPGPGPITVHAESPNIRRSLDLARRYHQRLHVAHVPHPDDLLAIDHARQAGLRVTCEVTPHHLFLSSEDAWRLGPYGQMKPPLVTPDLVARFWERLDLVDVIASDHAPHTRAEKDSATPPPGVPGLETTLPLLLAAVDSGRLTLERMVALTHHNPLAAYGLAAPPDTRVEVALEGRYALPSSGYQTRCGWTPFAGLPAVGRVERVWLRGTLVWEAGTLRVDPGYGSRLRRVDPV